MKPLVKENPLCRNPLFPQSGDVFLLNVLVQTSARTWARHLRYVLVTAEPACDGASYTGLSDDGLIRYFFGDELYAVVEDEPHV